MATQEQFAELASQLRSIPVATRELSRACPPQCPPSSLGVLSMISRLGELRMSRLAELLDVDLSVTSRHVAHLAELGWIDRLPDPYDKRSRLLRLTPGGAEMLRAAQARVAEALAHRLRDWPDEDVAEFSRLLDRLRGDFAADCRPRTPSTT